MRLRCTWACTRLRLGTSGAHVSFSLPQHRQHPSLVRDGTPKRSRRNRKRSFLISAVSVGAALPHHAATASSKSCIIFTSYVFVPSTSANMVTEHLRSSQTTPSQVSRERSHKIPLTPTSKSPEPGVVGVSASWSATSPNHVQPLPASLPPCPVSASRRKLPASPSQRPVPSTVLVGPRRFPVALDLVACQACTLHG